MSDRRTLDMRVAASKLKRPAHPRVPVPSISDLIEKTRTAACSVRSDTHLQEASELISRNHGAVLVTDETGPVGILSEADCARALLNGCLSGARILVREVMSPVRESMSASDTLYDCLRTMDEHDTRYLTIFKDSEAIGVVSREQVLAALVVYLERVFHERELDQEIVFLRGTYSC